MLNSKLKITTVVLGAALLFQLAPLPASAAYSQSRAVTFLKTKTIDEWSVLALAAAGALDGANLDFLKNPITSGRATDYEKRVLALAAAGLNPATAATENFVAAIENKFDGSQIGDAGLLNDDIFGLLALAAASRQNSTAASGSKTFLLNKQNSDGGWGYAPNTASDSNDTAMAISALLATGVSSSDQSVTKAVSFLNGLKQTDGGYAFSNGFSSDAASTSWAVAALQKTDTLPTSQTTTFLESLQLSDGSFRWQTADASGSALMTAYSIIALAGKTYPVGTGSSAGGTGSGGYQVCIRGQNATLWNGTATLASPARALDTVAEAAKLGNFTYIIAATALGPYVQTIGSDTASGARGWMFVVNGTIPSVGAADFLLKSNDSVTWFFGQSGDTAPVCSSATGDQASQSLGLSATIDIPVPPAPTVSFTLSPNSLNFGTLRPGQTSTQTMSLQNTGSAPITITAQVIDNGTLFKDSLRLDSLPVANFQARITAGQSRSATASVQVPNSFTTSGLRSATLTFWATP